MKHTSQASAFELGQQHAHLFLGFACFLHEQSRQHGVEQLFFCTREGVFFKEIYDTLFGGMDGLQGQLQSGLLEVSRLSSFAPSLLSDKSIDFNRLFRLYKKQSAHSLLVSLGLEPMDYADFATKHRIELTEKFEKPGSDPRFIAFLSDPDLQERIYGALEQQRRSILAYMNQHFDGKTRIGFVEIGWRGTTQNSIAKLYPEKTFQGYYLGLALERDEKNPNCSRTAYGPDSNLSTKDRDLLDAINVLEFVCLSTGGSAECYHVHPDGRVTAKMRHVDEEDRCVEAFSLPFQQGVLSVAREADPEALLLENRSGKLRTKAMSKWHNLLEQPDQGLVTAYFSLKSNERFGHGLVSDQAVVPSFTTVLLSLLVKAKRQELVDYLTYSQWAEGMWCRADMTLRSRMLFYCLMKLAMIYKIAVHSVKGKS